MANRNYMSIPDVRNRLREIADETGIDELRVIANRMYRRNHKGRRAPVTSQTVTPQLRNDIRAYMRKNPTASNQQAATHFGVNPGRISEALETG